jgi:hypothetical protein
MPFPSFYKIIVESSWFRLTIPRPAAVVKVKRL